MKRQADPILDRIEPELRETLEAFGYELVQAKLGGSRGNRILTLFIDKPGGVTVEDCRYMASRLSVLLDARDPIEGHYTLIVSSPGIERPLVRDEDFTRFEGSRAAIRYRTDDGKRRKDTGLLRGVSEGAVRFEVEGAEKLVPLDEIEAANLVHDWDEIDEDEPAQAEE